MEYDRRFTRAQQEHQREIEELMTRLQALERAEEKGERRRSEEGRRPPSPLSPVSSSGITSEEEKALREKAKKAEDLERDLTYYKRVKRDLKEKLREFVESATRQAEALQRETALRERLEEENKRLRYR